MDIFELTDKLNEALTLKDELADQTKANNKQIEQLKQELADQMIDNEMTSISRCGFKFTLQEKTRYSKKSEADLQAEGIDFHEALRAAGFGDLIVETVNPRSLQSSLANYVDENDELPEALAPAINTYETLDIARRKERR
jgi:hypothetical protein